MERVTVALKNIWEALWDRLIQANSHDEVKTHLGKHIYQGGKKESNSD